MIALAYVALATPLLQPLVDLARRQHWGGFWVRPTVIWITMGLLLMFLRTVLWLCYRPFAPAAAGEAPALTVIIPAYNEGAMVESSIASVAAANYPSGRLEIIAIDDGSKDDTWRYIERAARRFPGLVTPIRLPENRGKRGALAEGLRRGRGEVRRAQPQGEPHPAHAARAVHPVVRFSAQRAIGVPHRLLLPGRARR